MNANGHCLLRALICNNTIEIEAFSTWPSKNSWDAAVATSKFSYQRAAKLAGRNAHTHTQQAVCHVKRRAALFIERLYVPNDADVSASAATLCFVESTGTSPIPHLVPPIRDFIPHIHHLWGMFQGLGMLFPFRDPQNPMTFPCAW